MELELSLGVVTDNTDNDYLGKIKVSIFTLSTEGTEITCFPVFQKLGNDSYSSASGDIQKYQNVGQFFVPHVGQVVLVVYNKQSRIGYYLGSVSSYQDNVIVPEPAALAQGGKQEDVDVIARSRSGKSIVLSEVPGNSFLRLTGTKHSYSPSDPTSSVSKIDGNQSMIQINGQNDNVEIYSLNDIIIRTDNARIIMKKGGHIIIQGTRIDLNP